MAGVRRDPGGFRDRLPRDIRVEAGTFYFMTMITYVFVLAVGSDYNILIMSRLREEIAQGAAPHDAAAMAVGTLLRRSQPPASFSRVHSDH